MSVATSSRVQALVPERRDSSRPRPERVTAMPDPLARVMTLGDRAMNVGLVIGFTIALGAHVFASARVFTSLSAMLAATRDGRARIHEFLWATYDIEVAKKADEKPPEAVPEPEPEPEPKAPAPAPVKAADPYDPPPAPAKAGKVLTADPKGDQIEDMTNTIVSGDGPGTHGMVATNGVGDRPVMGRAVIGGVPGGKGTDAPKPQAAAPAGPDLSKPAGIAGGSGGNWNCPFPPEADGDSIDRADVVIRVTVKPDGSPASVSVVSDPGHGFGRAARSCALGRRYTAALDRTGAAVTQATPSITVHFTR